GESPDAWETKVSRYERDPGKARRHRETYATLMGRDVEDISNEDMVNMGLSQTENMRTKLQSLKDQGQGFTRKGADKYGRTLAQWDDPAIMEDITGTMGNAGYFSKYNYKQVERDMASGKLEKDLGKEERSWFEAARDQPVNLVAGAIDMGSTLAQFAVAGGSLSVGQPLSPALRALSQNKAVQEFFTAFDENTDRAKTIFTSQGQNDRERFDKKESALLAPLYGIRKKAYQEENPDAPEWHADVAATLDDAGDRIEYLIEEPGRILDGGFESGFYTLGIGMVGKAATKAALRQMNGRVMKELTEAGATPGQALASANRYAASKEGQKALKRVSTATGVSTVALTEGMSTSAEVYSSIMGMSEEEGNQSEKYRELRSAGLSHDAAKSRLASKAFANTFAAVTILAGVTSAVTGAGSFEAGFLSRMTGLIGKSGTGVSKNNMIRRGLEHTGRFTGNIMGPGARETVEEGIQSGGGELLSQINKQEATGKRPGPGVGTAMAEGALIGLGTGVAMASMGEAGGALLGGARVAAKALGKSASDLDEANTNVALAPEGTADVGGNAETMLDTLDSSETTAGAELERLFKNIDTAAKANEPSPHNVEQFEAALSTWIKENPELTAKEIKTMELRVAKVRSEFAVQLAGEASDIEEEFTPEEIMDDKYKVAVMMKAHASGKYKYTGEDPTLKNMLGAARAVQEAVDSAVEVSLNARDPKAPNAAAVHEEKMGFGRGKFGLGLQGHAQAIQKAIGVGKTAYTAADLNLGRFLNTQANKLNAYSELIRRMNPRGGLNERPADIEADVNKKYKTNIHYTSGSAALFKSMQTELQEMGKVRSALGEAAKLEFGAKDATVKQAIENPLPTIVEEEAKPTKPVEAAKPTKPQTAGKGRRTAQTVEAERKALLKQRDAETKAYIEEHGETVSAGALRKALDKIVAKYTAKIAALPPSDLGRITQLAQEAFDKADAAFEESQSPANTLAMLKADAALKVAKAAEEHEAQLDSKIGQGKAKATALQELVLQEQRAAARGVDTPHSIAERAKLDVATEIAEQAAEKEETPKTSEADGSPAGSQAEAKPKVPATEAGETEGKSNAMTLKRYRLLGENIAYNNDRIGIAEMPTNRQSGHRKSAEQLAKGKEHAAKLKAENKEMAAEMAEMEKEFPGIAEEQSKQQKAAVDARQTAQQKAEQRPARDINDQFLKDIKEMSLLGLQRLLFGKKKKLEGLDKSDGELYGIVDSERIALEQEIASRSDPALEEVETQDVAEPDTELDERTTYIEKAKAFITRSYPRFLDHIIFAEYSPRKTAVTEYAYFTRKTGKVTVFLGAMADSNFSATKVGWIVAHELFHAGFQMAFGEKLRVILYRAGLNSEIQELAHAIADHRKEDYRAISHIEEALVELATARKRGDFAPLQKRYGWVAPAELTVETKRNMRDWIQAVGQMIKALTGSKTALTSAEILNVIDIAGTGADAMRREEASVVDDQVTAPEEETEEGEAAASLSEPLPGPTDPQVSNEASETPNVADEAPVQPDETSEQEEKPQERVSRKPANTEEEKHLLKTTETIGKHET
ncbi:MAG: hypothetical protein DRH97_02375, partial [Chloroflexi bacterium]